MVTDETAFSALLRRYRGAAGLTQETLAERTGLSARGISDLERGVNERPRRETARLLADALNLTAEQRQDFQQAALLRNRTPLAREQAAEVETNLPATLTSFVGRASELVTLSTMLQRQDVRLLTLTGSGGVGKTRLALELAAANARHFPDGVFLIELAPLRDASLAPVAVARALEIQLPDQKPVVERLQEFFRRKRLLLLLDNFEHLLEAAPVLPQLLSSAPGLKCLVTSRAVLRVSGEHEFAVTPLLVPQLLYLPDSATLRQTPAVDLFVQRAQAANPDFEMTDANGAALAEICVRLDGLPLAIELAAARAKLLSPESLVTRLDNRLQLLVGGPRDLPPRQRTLVGTLAWSYDLLDLLEQRLFRWLSVFAGGWTLATAAALCADECDAAVRTFDGLASLADNSLVQTQSHADGGDRFLMLETIREYAAERLRVSGEEGAARDRHAQVFLDLAEESERRFQGAGRTAWGRVIVGEQENMRAALGWLLDGVKAELAQKLAGNLYWFWDAVGRPGEGRRWAEAALALPGGETPGVPRAAALFTAGGFAWQQGDLSAARARLIESAEMFRGLGDQHGLAQALQDLGALAVAQGDRAAATVHLRESASLFRGLSEDWNLALTLFLLGDATAAEDLEAAGTFYLDSLTRFRQQREGWGTALALTGLGGLALREGDYEAARTHFEEGLRLRRETGHAWSIAISLASLGEAARLQGDVEQAAGFLTESLTSFRRLGDQERIAWMLAALGFLDCDRDNISQAIAYFCESLVLRRDQGNRSHIAQSLLGLAVAALAEERLDDGARLCGVINASFGAAAAQLDPHDQRLRERTEQRLREAMGEDAFTVALNAGRDMSVDDFCASP